MYRENKHGYLSAIAKTKEQIENIGLGENGKVQATIVKQIHYDVLPIKRLEALLSG
tara:strand:- start:194 stop:361 length:168 start_codon:yes stop_codon:yes gene_type:complete